MISKIFGSVGLFFDDGYEKLWLCDCNKAYIRYQEGRYTKYMNSKAEMASLLLSYCTQYKQLNVSPS